MQEMRIKSAWQDIMGDYVARKTLDIRVKNRTLVIRLASGVLKEEFSYSKTRIAQLINESLEANVIDKVEIY